jgi:GT2 family glycosyltransferase
MASRPITVLIPVYGAVEALRKCLSSLQRCLPSDCETVILDDASPSDDVASTVTEFQGRLPVLRYNRNLQNVGFVKNCNFGMRYLTAPESDILLLNSDTEVTAGFMEEMRAVLDLGVDHAVVCPRSNNASIFSVPFNRTVPPLEAYETWQQMRAYLPRYTVMPTAVGFCMLIRRRVLHDVGPFDEIYSPGYNEENDFACRLRRRGYCVVAANQAFVNHQGQSSFDAQREALEARNRKILVQRYPEYPQKVREYVELRLDPVEHFASLFRRHRSLILYDLNSLDARLCDDSESALRLLDALAPLLEARHDLYLSVNAAAREFFGPALAGYRCFEPGRDPVVFDLVVPFSPIRSWDDFRRIIRLGARICLALPDELGIRDLCDSAIAVGRLSPSFNRDCIDSVEGALSREIDVPLLRRRWAHVKWNTP